MIMIHDIISVPMDSANWKQISYHQIIILGELLKN